MKKCLCVLGILAICGGGIIWAANGIVEHTQREYNVALDERDTLKGLQGIRVITEVLSTEGKEESLPESQLETDVESKLRLAGIKVLSNEEWFNTPGRASLYVIIKVIKYSSTEILVVDVNISLKQDALLLKDWNTKTTVITWNKNSTGVVSREKCVDSVRKVLKTILDLFIKDYLAANLEEKEEAAYDKNVTKGTGTIRYIGVEGGFYKIHADNGVSYDPINLPPQYAKDGIRVKFTVRYRPDMGSIHMSGKIVEILKIELQED